MKERRIEKRKRKTQRKMKNESVLLIYVAAKQCRPFIQNEGSNPHEANKMRNRKLYSNNTNSLTNNLAK